MEEEIKPIEVEPTVYPDEDEVVPYQKEEESVV